jgi:hypothetical protein
LPKWKNKSKLPLETDFSTTEFCEAEVENEIGFAVADAAGVPLLLREYKHHEWCAGGSIKSGGSSAYI